MSREEMSNAFKRNGHEHLDQNVIELAMDTTVEVANKCNVHLNLGKHYLPKIEAPKDDILFNKKVELAKNKDKNFEVNSSSFLKHICYEGLKSKGKISKEYKDRIDYELKVINDMGFPDYFLIMWDIMEFCRQNKIATGPARGCFLGDMVVNTKNRGPVKIKDVKVGDLVIGHEEIIRQVIKTLEYDCDEEILSLEVNGKNIECTKDHEIFAIKKEDWDKGIREPKWYKANELTENDYIAELE